ncbi:MAG: DUF6498-containing protein [Candidatus Diapherotrites archaeon]
MNLSFQSLTDSVQKDSSAKVLVLSNLITIVLAVVFSWSIMIILWSYWLQSVIIGFFNFFKILTLKDYSTEGMKISGMRGQPAATTGIKIFIAFFFAFHYGFFHLVYSFILGAFTFASQAITFTDLNFILLAGIIFFFNHLFSFLYFKSKPQKKANIGTVMFFPYARIIPMHLTIIFGGMFLYLGIGSVFVLILFLGLKTVADLVMHSIEHKEQLL